MFPGVGVDPSRNFPWPGPTLGVETIGGGVTAVGSDHAMAPIGSSTLGPPPNTGRPAEGFGALGSGSENSGRRFPDDPMRSAKDTDNIKEPGPEMEELMACSRANSIDARSRVGIANLFRTSKSLFDRCVRAYAHGQNQAVLTPR
ncbi:hypothetical protein B296_00058320 [Ensete ventricosum]|uniref:Uncharacterized protein n=1 Tax=Ensete ventricosum TaxID=4639 RepID=A0A426XBC2_ENSVE|nr:hypothetical protein B296_00058320 [Ensete ventricosum]